jgi:carboxyl-terminal processing protease
LGSLKLTTAGFYRINGDTTQLQGVNPDIVIPSTLDVVEIGEEYLPNVLSMNEIQKAQYRTQSDLAGVIEELRKRSTARLDVDIKYESYQALISRLKERNKLVELPLSYDQRMALARADRELTEMQREQFGIKDEEDLSAEKDDVKEQEEKDENDLILNETLRILTDLVTLGYRPNPS